VWPLPWFRACLLPLCLLSLPRAIGFGVSFSYRTAGRYRRATAIGGWCRSDGGGLPCRTLFRTCRGDVPLHYAFSPFAVLAALKPLHAVRASYRFHLRYLTPCWILFCYLYIFFPATIFAPPGGSRSRLNSILPAVARGRWLTRSHLWRIYLFVPARLRSACRWTAVLSLHYHPLWMPHITSRYRRAADGG